MNSYIKNIHDHISSQLSNVYLFGSDEVLKLLTVAYLAKGHVLLEGPPGTAKTLCAKLIASVISKSFNRIQFTSDMLPGDIIGAHIFIQHKNEFEFIKGPIFADFILADEINRTPPRTQSALLEAMEERQITSEGKEHKLSKDFFVIATQNPHDFEGTFPLPEAQLDRFLFKLYTDHAAPEVEVHILDKISKGMLPPPLDRIAKIDLDWSEVENQISSMHIENGILEYISKIIEATRKHPKLSDGSSVRGGIALVKCAKVLAAIDQRTFVTPDDVKELIIPTLSHRVRLSSESVISEVRIVDVLNEISDSVPFPK